MKKNYILTAREAKKNERLFKNQRQKEQQERANEFASKVFREINVISSDGGDCILVNCSDESIQKQVKKIFLKTGYTLKDGGSEFVLTW